MIDKTEDVARILDMNIKIQVTASDILDHGDWDTFCKIKGYNVWVEAYRIGLRRIIIDELEQASERKIESLCGSCQKEDAHNMHSCPYQEAIKANPSTDYCNCCDGCTTGCQYNV